MKTILTGLLAAATFAVALPAVANPTVEVRPGTYDPLTKTFHPLSGLKPGTITPDVTGPTYTGKLVTQFTITVASTFPTNAPIECDVSAFAIDNASVAPRFFTEGASVAATRSSATSATCTVTIPYSWSNLLTPSSDTVGLNYVLFAYTLPTSTGTVALTRYTAQDLATIKLPASGATTTNSVKATI